MGKSTSAQNARKHGLLAIKVVAKHEDKEEFTSLLDQRYAELSPQSAVEQQLVEQLAISFWRHRRLAVAERVVAMEGERLEHETFDLGVGPSYSVELRKERGVLAISDSLLFGRYQ